MSDCVYPCPQGFMAGTLTIPIILYGTGLPNDSGSPVVHI